MISHDEHGIPTITAGDVGELAREQGRQQAGARSWQLEAERRRSRGEWAALIGADGVAWDVLARRVGIDATAERAFHALDPETRDFVAAFSDGVNLGLSEAPTPPELRGLDAGSGRWQPWTPLAVFWSQQLLFNNFPTKLWREWAAARLPAELAPTVFGWQDDPSEPAAGSNAWVVTGDRTASGLPMIGGDPHRVIENPGCYLQVRLVCTDPVDPFDVCGFTFPGVPGVQHFGQAESVAWAITNAAADYQDLFIETLRREGGTVLALDDGRWQPIGCRTETIEVAGADPVPCEVLVTGRGPVVVAADDLTFARSLALPAQRLEDLGFGAVLALLRSRRTADVLAAWERWVEPVNNVVVADVEGAVAYRIAGRVPQRSAANVWLPVPAEAAQDWTGWTALPTLDPVAGQVVTANQHLDGTPVLGVEYDPGFRARRIEELLGTRGGLGPGDFAAIHLDVRLAAAEPLLAAVAALDGLDQHGRAVQDLLAGWDREMAADSVAAGCCAAVRSGLVAALVEDPMLTGLSEPIPDWARLYAAWFSPTTKLTSALPRVLADPGPIDLDGALRRAVAAAPLDQPWGDRHRFTPVHRLGADAPAEVAVPAVALPGDRQCVRSLSSYPGVTDHCDRGAVARYVWDLADRRNSGWVVPLGADATGEHRLDQLPRWQSGSLLPLPLD